MKKILILFFLITFIFSISVNAQLVDFETFENYEFTDFEIEYNSMNDEFDTDNFPENFFGNVGSLVGGNMSAQYLISNPLTSSVNTLEINTISTGGTPATQNFIYNVTICETSVISLTGDFNYGDCDTTPIILNEYFDVSTFCVNLGGDKQIPFDDDFLMLSTKKYIIDIKHISSNAVGNHFYNFASDCNAPVNEHAIRFTNNVSSGFTCMNNITLLNNDYDILNLHAQSNYKWDCLVAGTFPSCNQNVGAGTGTSNLEFLEDSGNNFIKLSALNGDGSSNFKRVQLQWNNDNTTGVSTPNNLTVQYDIKLFSETLGGNGREDSYAGIQSFGGMEIDTSDDVVNLMGGFIEPIDEIQRRIRGVWEGGIGGIGGLTPLNSSCDVDDGDWHTINHVIEIDGTPKINEMRIYIDGVLCESYISRPNFGAVAGSWISYLDFGASSDYSIGIDNIRVYQNIVESPLEVIAEDVLTCPVANCLFYDDFSDNDLSDYTGGESGYISDENLYFLSGKIDSFLNNNLISHTYKKVVGILELEFNETSPTPSELNEPNRLILALSTYCGDIGTGDSTGIAQTYNIVVIRDDDFTLSENRSVSNVYIFSEGNPKLLGSVVIENGDDLIIKSSFDENTYLSSINFLTSKDIADEFIPSVSFSHDYFSNCNEIGSFTIERRDSVSLEGYVGIRRIFYYGEEIIKDEDDFIFTNLNETSVNDSIIKANVEEYLHAGANTLGFRSTEGKFGFWILIMFFFVLAIYQSDSNESYKKYGAGLFLISFIILGWYFKFVPTIVFAFMIFIVSLIGALIYQKTFTGGNVNQ